jgi:hypothetical protein
MDWNNFPDFADGGISIDNGYLTIIYTPEVGSPITYKTPAPVWRGFLTQDQRIPITAIFNLRNDLNVGSNVTLTGAARWGKLSLGANITPISASANIDDTIRVIFNRSAPDIFMYMPDFDTKDQASISQWVSNPNLYASPEGFKKNTLIKVPAGENLGELKYQGLLSALTARFDLGAMYEYNDDLTLGVNFENVNRASLDFKTSGNVAYANFRSLPAVNPSGTTTSIPGNYNPVENQTLLIEPEKSVPLPQRLRMGATLKKPYLITLDYEFLLTPISMRYNYAKGSKNYTDMIFNDVRLIRAGFETQILSYPAYLRMGTILILTPELIGEDRETRATFDSMFAYGFYPIKLDIGLRFPRDSYEFGFSGGFSGMSFLSPFSVWFLSTPPLVDYRNRDMVSAIAVVFPTILNTYNVGDTLNQDFNRIAYFSTYLKKDNWQMTFQNAFDVGASGRAYNDVSSRKNIFDYLKWVTTLTLSLKF